MNDFLRSLLLITMLTTVALAAGQPAHAAAQTAETFAPILDRWTVTVTGDKASVKRQVDLDGQLTPLIRGDMAMQPASLEATLLANGASSAACSIDDHSQSLRIDCAYQIPLAGQQVALPGDTFLYFLLDIPVELAQGLDIDTIGQLKVPGIVAGIPDNQGFNLPNGGFLRRHYAISALSTLVVAGETRLSPGQLPVAGAFAPVVVSFLPRFQPGPSSWLVFALALALVLYAISRLLPVHARLPLEPQLWQPDLSRLNPLLCFLAALLVRLVDWLRQNWPRLLNTAAGTLLALTGIQFLLIAWGTAQALDTLNEMQLPLQSLLENLRLTAPVEMVAWPGWPLFTGGFGLLLLVTGTGMLVRWEMARLLFAASLLVITAVVIIVWPQILLAPVYLPYQLETLLIAGALTLFALTLLARSMTHPQFRRYYLGIKNDG